jgi:hypothetical protein
MKLILFCYHQFLLYTNLFPQLTNLLAIFILRFFLHEDKETATYCHVLVTRHGVWTDNFIY